MLRASRITVESSDRKAGDKSAGGVLLVDSFKFRDGGSLAWARVDLLHELNAFADRRRYFHL